MNEIIPKFISKIALVVFGIPTLFLIIYFIFLCSHPTDYVHISVEYKMKIGRQYVINLNKADLLERMEPAHRYSDTDKNIDDSLFVIYFPSKDTRINLNAYVRIIADSKQNTIIKFDSINDYSFRGYYDNSEIEKVVAKYDSISYGNQFYNNVIQKIINDSTYQQEIYFDNIQPRKKLEY
jgi:hypothetical protein